MVPIRRSDSEHWRGFVKPYIVPIYIAIIQNGNYRVFRNETDLEKYPYIIPLTPSQFYERYELLDEKVERLLSNDRGRRIHGLNRQGRDFTLTVTLREPGEHELQAGDELQPSECKVVAGRVVALHQVEWAEEQKRWTKRTKIARVFMLTRTSKLYIVDLHPQDAFKENALKRGTAQKFIFKPQSYPKESEEKHRYKFRGNMAASFGVHYHNSYDADLWEIKKTESDVICLEFAIARVTERDEQFILSALQNIGIVSSLVATVAISTHFSPPGFESYDQSNGLIAVNMDILIINNGVFTAFITLNAIALFSALASLFLAVVPQAWHVSSNGKRILDGPDAVALPLSMQQSHAETTAPVERYRALCTTLQFSLFFLISSLLTFAAALFVSGFLALFDNKWTMGFFICACLLILLLLSAAIVAIWWGLMKSSIKRWEKQIRGVAPFFRGSLHELATHNNHVKLSEILKDMNDGELLVDIDQRDEHGSTPLHFAAGNGCLNALKVLRRYKASLEARDDTGRTPLYYAAKQGHSDCVKHLLELGANPNAKNDQDGMTPLNRACQAGNLKCVQLLLEDPRTDPAQTDSHGSTCLHWAVAAAVSEDNNPDGCRKCYKLVLDKMGGPTSAGAMKKAGPDELTADDLWNEVNVDLWWSLY